MSVETVRAYLKDFGKADEIVIHTASTATVEEAAKAFGVIPGQIAKSLTFKGADEDHAVMIVFAGDARVDNHKFKTLFHRKASMLTTEEVVRFTGEKIGGVCPFAIPDRKALPIYLDVSLKRFATVYPACGSDHSGIPLTTDELFAISGAKDWIDAGKGWQEEP